ncbi:prepilin-type N-terminal cleavage/methylation domain-containing protein [Pyxidicoccus parkwayensis]|uniref:Prepilin-type N-terminal cleavage/methylation domain-containing protein n=1 Tax=Pyxidicoccus parkwayensis TaxID=2813578 RepID=A0ABX7NLY0_9BACT|nr:prepilin-type N-terminal cleavage/methylation domain-containing protein [Pyxidicoccus parkwaysis]QSQ19857.1 prepilin-type N-terminal cleavage/methylation domain-containing protein [Pyxidicoccus parkwaysis]
MSTPASHASRRGARGSSILEVLIAMAVLAMAATGAVAGMLSASRNVRDGQLYQGKRLLAEARTQRLWLADKAALVRNAVAYPAMKPEKIPVGTAPWTVDNTPAVVGDPGSGAYFELDATGTLKPATGIAPGTACNDTAVPNGTYCREVLVTQGLKGGVLPAPGSVLPPGASAVTVWTRVWRKGEDASSAVVHSEVFVQ